MLLLIYAICSAIVFHIEIWRKFPNFIFEIVCSFGKIEHINLGRKSNGEWLSVGACVWVTILEMNIIVWRTYEKDRVRTYVFHPQLYIYRCLFNSSSKPFTTLALCNAIKYICVCVFRVYFQYRMRFSAFCFHFFSSSFSLALFRSQCNLVGKKVPLTNFCPRCWPLYKVGSCFFWCCRCVGEKDGLEVVNVSVNGKEKNIYAGLN